MKNLNKISTFQSLSEKKQNLLAFSIIGIFALLLVRGAFYGVATPDESFYLTIPYRVILGDALLIDEWHASQLSAFLLYLPMKLFISVTGGTDGIILFFRLLFVFCQTAVSCFTFVRIRKYGAIPAIFSALMFLTYVTEQVHMLDYYTMTLMGFQVTGLILLTYDKLTKPKLIFAGIVFACTVTAQPFNSLVYFLYCIFAVIIFFTASKRNYSEFTKKLFSHTTWLYITIGIFLTAVVFILFLCSQAPLGELISNLGSLFSGQDHNLPFSQEADSDMFSYLTIAKTLLSFAPVSFCVSLAVVFLVIADKKRHERQKLWLYVSTAVFTVYFVVLLIMCKKNISAALFRPYPLFLYTLVLILLQIKPNKMLFSLWLSGVLYILFLGIVSQALDYVGAIGCVLSNTALIPALKELTEEIKSTDNEIKSKKNKTPPLHPLVIITSTLACSLCILFGGALEMTNDLAAVAMGRERAAIEVTLESGPLKGIRTDKNVQTEYESLLSDIKTIRQNTDGKVLVAGLIPWTYFCFDEPPATFTSWYIQNERYMFSTYYENEEHRPQCIYIPSTSFYWGEDYSNTQKIDTLYFKNMFKGTTEKGEIGTIFYVKKIL